MQEVAYERSAPDSQGAAQGREAKQGQQGIWHGSGTAPQASPMKIIGIGHEAGFCEVPEARFIRYMDAGFMSTIFIPGIPEPDC